MSPTRRLAVSLIMLAACTDDPVGPELDLQTPLVAFGAVRCGTRASRTVTVANPGDEPLELRAKSELESVTVAPELATVEPGSAVELTVIARAIPSGSNPIATDGGITLSSNAPGGSARIPVTFETAGVSFRISPAVLDFGSVTAGQTAFRSVLLIATGIGSAAINVNPASGSGFIVRSGGRLDLDAGHEASLSLEFHASGGSATAAGSVTIEAMAGELCTPTTTAIALHGTVIAL